MTSLSRQDGAQRRARRSAMVVEARGETLTPPPPPSSAPHP